MSALVIVESPSKAKTIAKFLGKNYRVTATYGHIRDLPAKSGSVQPDDNFRMEYEVPKTSSKHVEALVKAAQSASLLLLATDPDREGEAISWHVRELLYQHQTLQDIPCQRVVFHEITRRAIEEALAHARDVDMHMVNAQQARRALDYLVGFNLSPLLWKKVRRGLSAGRVQSVALRLVCEREAEIRAFEVREYWSIHADVAKLTPANTAPFQARLVVAHGQKLEKFSIANQETAQQLVQAIEQQPLFVAALEKKQMRRMPAPPFITSTLQQEASRKLHFSAKKTMTLAQKLYEGMVVPTAEGGSEQIGLITYMRTDSVNLADEAVQAIRQLVSQRFGSNNLPSKPHHYKSSAKNAQEAHEAIRPTNVELTPERLKQVLEPDLFHLYELIWKRAVASQMAATLIDQVVATLSVTSQSTTADFVLRATGATVVFPGFRLVYSEGHDEVSLQDRDDDDNGTLPALSVGEALRSKAVRPDQHFTEPPPRYTEATLVKSLESYGIGRPSTYAPTMSTLQDRGYVRLEQRRFYPEDVGEVVNKFLTEHFQQYVDYHFTANLEDELDAIARGEKEWQPVLTNFWHPFISQIRDKEQSTKRSELTATATDEPCPQCQKPLLIRLGRFGRFKACSGYPECRYTDDMKEGKAAEPAPPPQLSDQLCDKCQKPMQIKSGRFGPYLACSGYPACRNIQPIHPPKDTGIRCSSCGKGTFLEKKSRRGKLFYSCSSYPDCKNALWDRPITRSCPLCNAPIVTEKVTKRYGTEHICVASGCNFREKTGPAPT
ncbi:MAG: type I DNA topoisomerase [Magnetococcales bacterium]|nr:type I DNA topoisomerase [Magnetococcales bacterium]